MDVTSLYTNIPQNEGIEIVCKAYENFYKDNPPIGSFENEALENEDRSRKHPNLENEAPYLENEAPKTRNPYGLLPKLENEAPKSRKRNTLSRKRSGFHPRVVITTPLLRTKSHF